MNLFAVCAPGLETILRQEMARLGLSPRPSPAEPAAPPAGEEEGGVEFEGGLKDIYRANLWLRTASRVLLRIEGGEFPAVGFPELRRKVHNLPWERYLSPGQPIYLRVSSHASRLYMKRVIAEHIAQGITARLGKPSPLVKAEEGDGAAQLILARIQRDLCTLSVDSSGEHLHRRGYKLAVAKAPLRENLAAGMLLAAEWEGAAALLDPFCGSGTIPIEAALLAGNIPPGRLRRFQFQSWPGFAAALWQEILRAADAQRKADLPLILASDRDAGAIQMAQENAQRAGVADCIQWTRQAVSAITPPQAPGWLVTNPPYGVRVSETQDLRNLYAQFGHVLRAKCPAWRVFVLCPDDRLLGQTSLRFEYYFTLNNGGLAVKLMGARVS